MRNALIFSSMLFMLLFSSYAFAVNCNMLDIKTYDVEVQAGSSKTVTFLVENYAPERFYIDKVNAFDFEQGIRTEEQSWQSVALSQQSAAVRVSIEAEKNAAEGERTASVELHGHFLGGTECGYNSVHASFKVNVVKEPVHRVESRCEGFSLYTLKEKRIGNTGELDFVADNKSNYPAVIKLESPDLGLSDDMFYVPAGEEKNFSVQLQASSWRAELTYNVELSDCGIPNRKTIVYSSAYENTPVEPTPQPTPEETRNIEVSAAASRDENGFLVEVSVYNPNSEPVSGELNVLAPEGWLVAGTGLADIPAHTEIKADIRIVPPAGFTGSRTATVMFNHDGVSEAQDIELKVEKSKSSVNAVATAMAVLGPAAIVIGLIVVIAVFVVLLGAGPTRQELEPWVEAKK